MTKAETKKSSQIEFSFGNVDAIHDEILDASPDPNLEVIAAHSVEEEQTLREQVRDTDKDGTIFNADIHAVNKDGDPSVTPTGKFRKKRGSIVATKTVAAQTIQDEAAARAAGHLAADMMIGTAVVLLGDEWIPVGVTGEQEPIKFDEHSNLRRVFGEYFVAKNISDFPPGIALSIAVSSYAGARLAGGKETKSRLSEAWAWTSDKFKKWFGKEKADAPHDNSRDNGIRKDDTRKEPVRTEQKIKEGDNSP